MIIRITIDKVSKDLEFVDGTELNRYVMFWVKNGIGIEIERMD